MLDCDVEICKDDFRIGILFWVKILYLIVMVECEVDVGYVDVIVVGVGISGVLMVELLSRVGCLVLIFDCCLLVCGLMLVLMVMI